MTQVLITLWWLGFFAALGLCIGSFLNAVIYRLPRNRSLRNPLWSACPNCRNRIRWYDNIPVVSFVLLRGRCRDCAVPISTRYVVIELLMAIVVLMLVDALFIGQSRGGIFASDFGLTDELAKDWPILMAHIILFACLLPMSAIDIEHYWVDVRFTNLATIAGFVLHTIWTPKHSMEWIRPSDATAIVSLFALAVLAIVWIVSICRGETATEDPQDADDLTGATGNKTDSEHSPPRKPPPSLASPTRTSGWISAAIFLVLFLLLLLDEGGLYELRHTGRALVPLVFMFFLIVSASTTPRASDQEIAEAIHEERHTARRMVLSELALFLPVVVAGLLGLWVMSGGGDLAGRLSGALHGRLEVPGVAALRNWTPLYGLATAASGYIIAGSLGWTVRIVFTLMFGKEAFGSGDIHMMAAAGCIAGWPVVVLSFVLTCGLALLGWIMVLPFKRTRALPLGPWLALSFLIVVICYNDLVQLPVISRAIETFRWLFLENSQITFLGG